METAQLQSETVRNGCLHSSPPRQPFRSRVHRSRPDNVKCLRLGSYTQQSRRLCLCRSTAVVEQADSGVRERVPALPFVKLAGQDDMKLALLLNVVDQTIGGVLIMGDRGTGKSVAVSGPALSLFYPGACSSQDAAQQIGEDAAVSGQSLLCGVSRSGHWWISCLRWTLLRAIPLTLTPPSQA